MNDQQNFEQCREMLNYFQDEWKYRDKLVWNLFFKFFTFNTVIDILPFVTSAFGLNFTFKSQTQLFIFPILGLVISLFVFILLKSECTRLSYVGKAKYRIINSLPVQFHYEQLPKTRKLANFLPSAYLIAQMIIVFMSLIIFFS